MVTKASKDRRDGTQEVVLGGVAQEVPQADRRTYANKGKKIYGNRPVRN